MKTVMSQKKEGPAYSAGPSYEINEGFSSSLQLFWS
jgi:hypothetical protein